MGVPTTSPDELDFLNDVVFDGDENLPRTNPVGRIFDGAFHLFFAMAAAFAVIALAIVIGDFKEFAIDFA